VADDDLRAAALRVLLALEAFDFEGCDFTAVAELYASTGVLKAAAGYVPSPEAARG